MESSLQTVDYLWNNLKGLPYFRALLRAVEARAYQEFSLTAPVFDLGCGDGHFAEVTFKQKIDVGLDPWTAPVREAGARDVYRLTVQAAGDHIPFANETFQTAVSNSVLEHIPDLEPVLKDLARILKPGGIFLFTVPNQRFLGTLSIARWLDRIGWQSLAKAYRDFFNRISRHHHCDSPVVWSERLQRAGFELISWRDYFSPEALHALEWGHYFGLPSWILHALCGKWIVAPWKWNLQLTQNFLQRFYDENPQQAEGVYTFYVARRCSQSEF